MEGFYRLNNAVLTFDPIKDVDKIIFNQYIIRKENMQRLKHELPEGQFYLSENVAAMDLNFSRSKITRLIETFKELGIIEVVTIFPKNLRKASIYQYLITISTYKEIEHRNEHQIEHRSEHQTEHQKQRIINAYNNECEHRNEHQTEHRNEHQTEQSKKELLNRISKKNNKKDKNTSSSSDEGATKNSSSKDEIEKQIEELWKAYPHKKGKATAIKKIPKLIKKYGYDQMARCVSRYAEECRKKGTEQEYIKHGSTFFNGGYMDYLDQDKSSCSNDTEKNRQFDEEQREASKELEGMTAKERELYTYTLTIDLDGITPRYKDGQEIPKVYKYGIWMYVAKDGD